MTNKQIKELNELLDYWVGQLRLENWRFELKIVPWDKETEEYGRNQMDPNYENSVITLTDPSTIPEDHECMDGVVDVEVTLVHELLHTRLVYVAKTIKKRKEKWAIEISVETIARALVAQRRGIDLEDLS